MAAGCAYERVAGHPSDGRRTRRTQRRGGKNWRKLGGVGGTPRRPPPASSITREKNGTQNLLKDKEGGTAGRYVVEITWSGLLPVLLDEWEKKEVRGSEKADSKKRHHSNVGEGLRTNVAC